MATKRKAVEHDNALRLPVDYYRPIGEVIANWAQLEYQMHEIIWRSLGVDNKVGRTLTIGTDARVLSGILRTLKLRWLTTKYETDAVDEIIKGVDDLYAFRNNLAHGSWQYPKGGTRFDVYLIYMKKQNQRILPEREKLKPEDIKAKADQIQILNKKAQHLIHHLDKRPVP